MVEVEFNMNKNYEDCVLGPEEEKDEKEGGGEKR